jgi:hypothetical protein
VALDPDHAPEAVQLEAFVEAQEIVIAELTEAEEDEEEMVTVGIGAGVPPPPPPHPAARTRESKNTHHPSKRMLLCNVMDLFLILPQD